MRFNKRITFVKVVSGGTYNPMKGENDAAVESYDTKPCSATSLPPDKEYSIYGTREGGIQIVRLQQDYEAPFNYALIGGVRYEEVKTQELTNKSVYRLKRADF